MEQTTPGEAPSPLARSGGPFVICHLIASAFVGGPEKQILEVSSRLVRAGWTVIVGSFRENRPFVPIIEAARAQGFGTFMVDTRSPFNPGSVGQLRRFLEQHRIELLITHGYKSNMVGYAAARGTSFVQVPIVRGYTAEDWKVRLYERLDRRLLRRFGLVLCVSEGTKRRMIGHGLDSEHIRVLHNAVDPGHAVKPIDLRTEFHLPPETRVLVAAGRLSPEKGHRDLVDAVCRLKAVQPPIHLLILGSGKEEPRLRRQIRDGGLEDRVHLAGFRDDVPCYLAGADLVVNPSLTEGLPNVLLEALAVGAPVVATDVGGTGELIIPQQTGWLVPPGSAVAMAEAIDHALSHPAQAREMAERGRRLVSRSFSFSSQAAQLASLLVEALPNGKGALAGDHP
jgi:glycosyltransferase involved in cell wall biosynthesis